MDTHPVIAIGRLEILSIIQAKSFGKNGAAGGSGRYCRMGSVETVVSGSLQTQFQNIF